MDNIKRLQNAAKPYLTDGGFETWMFFEEGFEAPEFAAIVLMDDEDARDAMRRYFDRFIALAEAAGTGFVLDTNTWRGCASWSEKLARSPGELLRLTVAATDFAKEIRSAWQARVSPIILNGVIGPAGDAYAPGELPTTAKARDMHLPQIETFAREGVDMISAITMTNIAEATGIVVAAADVGLPAVISFTVETDGRLPAGETLSEAIAAIDAATSAAPLYYMINCAHPDHFRESVTSNADWVKRIGGLRANASRLSHAELDASETLDNGDPEEFGHLHTDLAARLPNLRVVGGCCGTDHRHVGCVSHHLHVKNAA